MNVCHFLHVIAIYTHVYVYFTLYQKWTFWKLPVYCFNQYIHNLLHEQYLNFCFVRILSLSVNITCRQGWAIQFWSRNKNDSRCCPPPPQCPDMVRPTGCAGCMLKSEHLLNTSHWCWFVQVIDFCRTALLLCPYTESTTGNLACQEVNSRNLRLFAFCFAQQKKILCYTRWKLIVLVIIIRCHL